MGTGDVPGSTNLARVARRQCAPGEIQHNFPDFDAAEAIATVAAHDIPVVALLVLIGNAVAAAGVSAPCATPVGDDVAVACSLIAFFAGIESAVAAEGNARAIDALATGALVVLRARVADIVDTEVTDTLIVIQALLLDFQQTTASATIAILGVPVVARLSRLADAVPYDRRRDAAAGEADVFRSALIARIARDADFSAAETAAALDGTAAPLALAQEARIGTAIDVIAVSVIAEFRALNDGIAVNNTSIRQRAAAAPANASGCAARIAACQF